MGTKKTFYLTLVVLLLTSFLISPIGQTVEATEEDSEKALFVNLTSDDQWRSGMATEFATKTLKKGYKATIFLNLSAVHLVQKGKGGDKKGACEKIKAFIKAGGKVIACPMCMKKAGIEKADLVESVEVATDSLIDEILKDDVQVMSW